MESHEVRPPRRKRWRRSTPDCFRMGTLVLVDIVHKNHGPDFWALVGQYMPDYKRRRALLKK